jgi:ABC-2 type transport system permease protein
MLRAYAGTELRLTLRNGEQILLTLLIPLALLLGLVLLSVLPAPAGVPRALAMTPRVLALAVMSTTFTGQAIALGFDRRYGALKRLAATAVPRWALVAGRVLAALGVVGIQVLLLGVVAVLIGWRPPVLGLLLAVPVLVLGSVAFGGLGALLGGTLRAEIVLAVANIVWFALLLAGGILLAPGQLPHPAAVLVELLPSGALVAALQAPLQSGAVPGLLPVLVLVGWSTLGTLLAARHLRLT